MCSRRNVAVDNHEVEDTVDLGLVRDQTQSGPEARWDVQLKLMLTEAVMLKSNDLSRLLQQEVCDRPDPRTKFQDALAIEGAKHCCKVRQ
jgi:hypothetical protein